MSSASDRIPANEPNLSIREGFIIVAGLLGLLVVLTALRFLFIYCLDVFLLGHGRVVPWRRNNHEARDPAGTNEGQQEEQAESTLNGLLSGLSLEERSAVLAFILDRKTVTSEDVGLWNGERLSDPSGSTKQTENTGSNRDNTCSICLQNIVIGNVAAKSKSCSHVFHQDCLLQWLERNTECPYCRSRMITEDDVKQAMVSEDVP